MELSLSSSSSTAIVLIICIDMIYFSLCVPSPGVANIGTIDVAAEEDSKQLPVEMEDILVNKRKRFDCPLCDASVFTYCNDKLLHDACCCLSSYETELPLQCKFADCSFLHSNSCQEHRLITACCCNQLLFTKK